MVIRDLGGDLAESFASYIVANYAPYLSLNRVYNYLRSSHRVRKERVAELFNRARESHFAFPVELFERSEEEGEPQKVYLIDTDYAAALGYQLSISRAMENCVYLELMRRGWECRVFYWKEYGKAQGAEVDFVLARDFRVEEIVH